MKALSKPDEIGALSRQEGLNLFKSRSKISISDYNFKNYMFLKFQKEHRMPVTISYDLETPDNNQRNYIRSMFERFGWLRLGGSVFRYEGRKIKKTLQEDWLNDVVPSLMFFRSYILRNNIKVKYFTLDSSSVARLDFSDIDLPLGSNIEDGDSLKLREPTNVQSSVKTIQGHIKAAQKAT